MESLCSWPKIIPKLHFKFSQVLVLQSVPSKWVILSVSPKSFDYGLQHFKGQATSTVRQLGQFLSIWERGGYFGTRGNARKVNEHCIKKKERNQHRTKDTLLLKVSQPLCMLPDFGSGPTCPELHNKIIKRNGEKQQIPLITFPPRSCIAVTVCGWRLLEMQMLE